MSYTRTARVAKRNWRRKRTAAFFGVSLSFTLDMMFVVVAFVVAALSTPAMATVCSTSGYNECWETSGVCLEDPTNIMCATRMSEATSLPMCIPDDCCESYWVDQSANGEDSYCDYGGSCGVCAPPSVCVNTATHAVLDTLFGIGPTAQAAQAGG